MESDLASYVLFLKPFSTFFDCFLSLTAFGIKSNQKKSQTALKREHMMLDHFPSPLKFYGDIDIAILLSKSTLNTLV